MEFEFCFEFHYDNAVKGLQKRINAINRFLAKHLTEPCNFRHLGIEIFQPGFSVIACNKKSVRKYARNDEHSGHYILGFFFFKSRFEEVGNLTILLDLGKNLKESIANDVKILSAIAATDLNSVFFTDTGYSIQVNIKGNDTNNFLSNHLTLLGKDVSEISKASKDA